MVKKGRQKTEKRGGRTYPLSPEAAAIIEEPRRRFVAKFGREPSGDDPIFFDREADEPRPFSPEDIASLEGEAAATLEQFGVSPAIVYAFRKTGRLVTEANAQYLTPEDLEEWQAAIDEFKAKN